MKRSFSFLRSMAVAAVVAAGIFSGSTAAVAAFTDGDQAAPRFSAASLDAPAAANVTMSCTSGNRATVTVNSFSSVANANYHEVRLFDRSGSLQFTGDLSQPSGRTYAFNRGNIGTWTYEIRGYYKVPGTSNMWTGKALQGSLVC
ncbi:hypothetical protein ACIPY2_10285 [Paenarthrobacter sp. NPDC089675]|uniref:hypothetical protein n=1 Tax=Paenarthrobacter sp. NPDC089675 TaxID=3364376 RepID=UPI00380A131C